MRCEVCGHSAPQALVKRTTKFTLFFVPLFPVRPSRSYLECGHCRAFRPVGHGVLTR
ncbi:MAG TPA: zinc-ribbon domain-containing protein [Micromonosporaceae bacterium]|nr:zinc-ribbon domain-containing protein [Micromonosporaceae bacterium]